MSLHTIGYCTVYKVLEMSKLLLCNGKVMINNKKEQLKLWSKEMKKKLNWNC